MIEQANKHKRPSQIVVGDLVWVKSKEFAPEENISQKLLPAYRGPWQVLDVIGDVDGPSYAIGIPLHLHTYPVFHASKLLPCVNNELFPSRRSAIPPSMDGRYDVDKIIVESTVQTGRRGRPQQQYKATTEEKLALLTETVLHTKQEVAPINRTLQKVESHQYEFEGVWSTFLQKSAKDADLHIQSYIQKLDNHITQTFTPAVIEKIIQGSGAGSGGGGDGDGDGGDGDRKGKGVLRDDKDTDVKKIKPAGEGNKEEDATEEEEVVDAVEEDPVPRGVVAKEATTWVEGAKVPRKVAGVHILPGEEEEARGMEIGTNHIHPVEVCPNGSLGSNWGSQKSYISKKGLQKLRLGLKVKQLYEPIVTGLSWEEWEAVIWLSFPVILVDEILKWMSRNMNYITGRSFIAKRWRRRRDVIPKLVREW
ncbi:hypothetical protein CBR_g19684 [Chara braunii]|uniref:Tf2-1-like SH3-like domain-containing protein n=1 Tax=Chara braunii TaxID=69332 RepID=A0A388KYQ4_CHABU|nr:hypothetical protein CBR_g19684 [Chara braunii]|eukprot:GBG75171.1 hypothetical protein CBR_g19684 [Chara braunii]